MLTIADTTFSSRLLTGTGKFASRKTMAESLAASGTELVTMALKRVDVHATQDDILTPLRELGVRLLPNTSGAKKCARSGVCGTSCSRSIGDALGKAGNSPRSQIFDA